MLGPGVHMMVHIGAIKDLDKFKAVARKLVEMVDELEWGTQFYTYSFDEEACEAFINEGYDDAQGFKHHMANAAERGDLVGQLVQLGELRSIHCTVTNHHDEVSMKEQFKPFGDKARVMLACTGKLRKVEKPVLIIGHS